MAEIQDEPFDGAAEGLEAPDDITLEQDREDRLAAESQTKPAEAEAEGDEFEFETPDGKVVRLSAEQAEAVQTMLDAEERAAALEAENKALKEKPAAEAAKPAEAPAQAEGEGIFPVQAEVVGKNFQDMLYDEERVHEIGPALLDVIERHTLTSPRIAHEMKGFFIRTLQEFIQADQQETSFKAFVGDEPTEAEVAAFRKDNPWADNKMAILGAKKSQEIARLKKEVEDLKAGKPAAEKAAKAKGAEETVRSMKAKGTLRRVTTGRSTPAQAPTGKPRTENELIQKQVARIQAMRQGN